MNNKVVQAGDMFRMFRSTGLYDVVIAIKIIYGDVWELYNMSTNMYIRDYYFALTNPQYYMRIA